MSEVYRMARRGRPAGAFAQRQIDVFKILNTHPETRQMSDETLAKQIGQSERQVQKILLSLKKANAIEIQHRRFRHPQFGWCNARTINIKDS